MKRELDAQSGRDIKKPGDFTRSEEGGMTIMSLYLGVTCLIVGGFAVDVSNLMSTRTQLQVAADYAAHAALYTRETEDALTSKEKALELAMASMPQGVYAGALTVEDINFGTYNFDTQEFTIDESATGAVVVETSRLAERANPVTSILLKLVGAETFDLRTRSVFETYRNSCLREGFVAQDVVEIQSNNSYFDGFCIHSNQYVTVSSGNFWEDGAIVSMPSKYDVDLPASGFDTNPGLEDALRSRKYWLRVLNRMEEEVQGLWDPDNENYREWLVSDTPRSVVGKQLDDTDFPPGYIYNLSCNGGKATIDAVAIIKEVVIITDCEIKFSQDSALEDVLLYNTNTGVKSINSPSSLRLGRYDDCTEGGGAQILTHGGFNVPAALEMNGAQIIAAGPIVFSANADGLNGASMISGETIDGTSNMNMAYCGSGMEDNIEVDYFRMRG